MPEAVDFRHLSPCTDHNAQHAARLRRLLTTPHTARGPENLNQPHDRPHRQQGHRTGAWSVCVSGNRPLLLEFDGTYVNSVDLVDYH